MVRRESRPNTISHITLGTKQTGAPSAGNLHAGCDVAGAGNGFTVWLLRHSQRKRGATARLDLRNTAPVLDPTGIQVVIAKQIEPSTNTVEMGVYVVRPPTSGLLNLAGPRTCRAHAKAFFVPTDGLELCVPSGQPRSLKFCVLCLGLLEDWDIRVGVFPQDKEFLIGGAGFVALALQRVRSRETEMGEHK